MAKPIALSFHTKFKRFAASRLGTWLFSIAARHADGIFLKLSRGRLGLTTILSGLPLIVLTTIGARSGRSHTLPLVYVHDPLQADRIAILATNFGNSRHPAWYYNLKSHPRVTGSIKGEVKSYLAREAFDDEYDHWWQRAVETYIGYAVYKLRAGHRHIPIIVLTSEIQPPQ